MDPSELVALIATLNPENTPGRLAVIVRMGASKLRAKLPALIEAVQQAGQVVAWVCDPMHGNTEDCQGFKTRRYDNIRAEVEAFFDVHEECGSVPGGIHLEMTGECGWLAGWLGEKARRAGGLAGQAPAAAAAFCWGACLGDCGSRLAVWPCAHSRPHHAATLTRPLHPPLQART